MLDYTHMPAQTVRKITYLTFPWEPNLTYKNTTMGAFLISVVYLQYCLVDLLGPEDLADADYYLNWPQVDPVNSLCH